MPERSGFQPIILVDLNTPWEKVLDQGRPLSFAARTIISASSFGEFASGMYYIKKGHVRLSSIAANGQEKMMFYMGHGTFFNEIPMLQAETDYLFTCMDATDAIFFPKKRITEDFIRRYPELMLNLLESMSRKTRSFYAQLGGLRAYDTFANVCRILYSMHLYNRSGGRIAPRLTQQEFAAFLGVHRSSLHKALFRLQNEGVIGRYSRAELEIHDLERLLAYAEGGQ